MAENKKKATTKKVVAENKQEESNQVAENKQEESNQVAEKADTTYIMKVTHLSWGRNGRNHFYSEKKPLITEKVMGKYAGTLKVWIEAGWVIKGKYK